MPERRASTSVSGKNAQTPQIDPARISDIDVIALVDVIILSEISIGPIFAIAIYITKGPH
jgi:hypothetical protein